MQVRVDGQSRYPTVWQLAPNCSFQDTKMDRLPQQNRMLLEDGSCLRPPNVAFWIGKKLAPNCSFQASSSGLQNGPLPTAKQHATEGRIVTSACRCWCLTSLSAWARNELQIAFLSSSMLPTISFFSSSLASCFFVLLLAAAGSFLTVCFWVYFYPHENFHFFFLFFSFFFFFFFFFFLLLLAVSCSCRFLFLLSFLPLASCPLFPWPRFAPFFLPFASCCLLFVSCLLRSVLAANFYRTLLLVIFSLRRSRCRRLGSAEKPIPRRLKLDNYITDGTNQTAYNC